MRTSLCLSVAALLTIGLSACGGSGDTSSPAPAPAPASQAPASQAPASSAPASSAPSSGAPSSAASSGESSGAGGQGTPEAAAEAFLKALGNKDAQGVCDALAVQGKPMNSIGAGDMCTRSMENTTRAMPGGMLNNLKNAKVSNVQVNGDTADLSTATITPPEAQGVLNVYQTAQKIDGKWYVSAPMA